MTPTNEDLLALADRLDEGRSHCGHCGAEAVEQNSRGQYICVACLRENLVRVAHSLRYDAAAALRAIVAERQAIRDKALDDAARAVSDRAAYWWDEATAADDTGRKKLSLIYEAKALACTELAAAIRVMKGTKA